MSTLYELRAEYLQLLNMMEDPEADPKILKDTLDAIGGEIEEKAESYAIVIKELEGELQKFKTEADRLSAYCLTLSNRIRMMKLGLHQTMDDMGVGKIQTDHFRVSIDKNGGLQPMYVSHDIEAIPEEYIIRTPAPDNKKIRKALEDGQELEFAHLMERGTHLSIR